jgi:D-alanyl-D-alanine carboxypeptidase/D-alanyl-D-alanine-endopeptidase (penicillin-binding protein 4)
VLIDDTAFDSVRLGVDWANDDESAAYAAQISALSLSPDSDFDAGTVIVTARATVEGDQVVVNIHPANTIMTVTNSVTIGAANTLRVSREHGSNRLLVSGTLPAGTAARKWVSVWEPTRLVADVFHRALIAQGIKVDGRTVIGVTTPSGARPLAAHDSLPLAQLLTPLLKLSNNNMTEVLLKTMGRSTGNVGTAESGIAVVNSFLQRHGLQGSAIVQVDGSGLSRRNLISTQSLTDLLLRVRHQPWFDYWYAALPIAGNPERMLGGTLRNRLRGTFAQDNLHAKTGTMTAVSSLSGYLRSVEGRALVFAMISNNYLAEGAAVKSLEDKVAVALTQWSD